MGVVRVEHLDGGVALLTLNKPERMNAWSQELSEDLFEALNDCEVNLDVRVVVVTGEGRAFCAGADAQGRFEAPKDPEKAKRERAEKIEKMKKWSIKRIHDISKMRLPVIACINGGCVGIGLSFALACDMRFAAAGAKIGTIFPQRGLIAEDGLGYYLPHLVGTGDAMLMLLTGDVFKAEELPAGVVQRIFPRDALVRETLAFATRLATNSSPSSLAVIKRQVCVLPHRTLEEAQAINDRIQDSSLREENPDHHEGFAAFTGKRAPKFNPYNGALPFVKKANELMSKL
mmetsp:Transcript_114179/g.323342  ORF Transcript_114179/g.323342 Transcript_114179/m.323342 type:complete len:288 (-) Transcript_114179:98-961(-)